VGGSLRSRVPTLVSRLCVACEFSPPLVVTPIFSLRSPSVSPSPSLASQPASSLPTLTLQSPSSRDSLTASSTARSSPDCSYGRNARCRRLQSARDCPVMQMEVLRRLSMHPYCKFQCFCNTNSVQLLWKDHRGHRPWRSVLLSRDRALPESLLPESCSLEHSRRPEVLQP
jgi:hypothetical protein